MAAKPLILAIVGRPNVGKSTLFNRIVGSKQAIVEDTPGVTRDRNYALVDRYSVPFTLVDTGGFEKEPSEELARQVVEQTLIAIEEADIILALFDGSVGLQPGDWDVVELLRQASQQVSYIVNKCDGVEQAVRVAEFYELGVDTLHDISALHGRGVHEHLEATLSAHPRYAGLVESNRALREREDAAREEVARIVEEEAHSAEEAEPDLSDEFGEEEEFAPENAPFAPVYEPGEGNRAEDYERQHRILPLEFSVPREHAAESAPEFISEDVEETPPSIDVVRFAIIGRPNVGKSTLTNTLLGEERVITSPVAGTTRDSLSLGLRREGQAFELIDTAGLRKKARVESTIERYSVLRTLSAINESDVAVLLIDATAGATEQDAKIAGLAHDQGVGLIIAVNKWDLVEKTHRTVHEFTKDVREVFKFAAYAPIVFISAVSGRRCAKVLDEAHRVALARLRRVPTGTLNRILSSSLQRSSQPAYRGRQIKLYYGVQIDVSPPRFALFFNYPRAVHFSTLRALKNGLRESFEFPGTDIKLVTRKR